MPVAPDMVDDSGLTGYGSSSVNMLWSFADIFFILWVFGLATAHTFGGIVHAFLLVSVVLVLVRIIQGRALVAG